MEITRSIVEGKVGLTVVGELDASTAIEMDNMLKALLEEEKYEVVINLSDLSYISSAGVGVFISFIDDFTDKGGNLALHSLQDNVLEVFSMLGLDGILTIVGNEAEAVAAF